jgi:Domain of unknown function (DUF5753)
MIHLPHGDRESSLPSDSHSRRRGEQGRYYPTWGTFGSICRSAGLNDWRTLSATERGWNCHRAYGTTTIGHLAWWTTWLLTAPRLRCGNPPPPLVPTTSRSASAEGRARARTRTGLPRRSGGHRPRSPDTSSRGPGYGRAKLPGRGEIAADVQLYICYEDETASSAICHYEVVRGILQTEAYARCILANRGLIDPMPPAMIERLVRVRLRRQQILTRQAPAQVSAVLDESILRSRIGDGRVMHDQLAHLAELAERPNITRPGSCLWTASTPCSARRSSSSTARHQLTLRSRMSWRASSRRAS